MGSRIREIRESCGMTLDELSTKSGVSRGVILALENGTAKITTVKTLVKIALALETTIDHIFFTSGA